MHVIWVAFFGMLGVLARFGFGRLVNATITHPFPIATFTINLSGAFLIGVVAGLGTEVVPSWLRAGLMIGFLGGFTTFSSFCLETEQLLSLHQSRTALLYFLLSPPLGLGAVYLGHALAHGFRS